MAATTTTRSGRWPRRLLGAATSSLGDFEGQCGARGRFLWAALGFKSQPTGPGGYFRPPACSPAWRVVLGRDSVKCHVAHGAALELWLQ